MKTNNNNLDLQDFFANFSKAVQETGLTPYALAKKVGVDKQAISRLLDGDRDPQLSTILCIVKGMQISMDELMGHSPINLPDKPIPIPKVEPKIENAELANKISKMHENDVELLEAIIKVLDERRARAVARLVHAINSKKEKESLMAKASEKERALPNSDPNDEDDFEDDNEFEDEDFDDEDIFDEDGDFDSDEDDYDDDDDNDEDDFDNE